LQLYGMAPMCYQAAPLGNREPQRSAESNDVNYRPSQKGVQQQKLLVLRK